VEPRRVHVCHHRRELLLGSAVPSGRSNERTAHRHVRDLQPGDRAVRQGHSELWGDNTRRWTALVGKARALLDLNQPAAAAALLGPVPDNFTFEIEHSGASTREQNGTYEFNAIAKRWSMSDLEGGNGLPFLSANDPRVPYTSHATDPTVSIFGFDAVTPLFVLLKYTSTASPTRLADGVKLASSRRRRRWRE